MDIILYKNPIFTNLKNVLNQNLSKKLIVDFKGRSITGAQILNSIDKIAITLATKHIQKNDRIIFLAQPSIESILYFFALTRTGACVVLADPEMGQDNFIERVTFSKAKWLLQDSILEKVENYSFIKPILRLFKIWFPENLPITNDKRITIESLDTILSKDTSNYSITEKTVDDKDDLAIIFTSGTTGIPKGVVHSYKSLYEGIKLIIKEVPINSSDYVYASQLYFLLIALNIPAKIYIPKSKPFNPKRFINIVLKQQITSTFLLPFEGQKIYELCSSKKTTLPMSLQIVLFGSAPVTKGFLSRFKKITSQVTKVFGVYGATEMLIISMMSMDDKLAYIGEGDFLGKLLPGVTVQLSDEYEMLITGPQMYTRYLGDNDAQFFFSGDLGKINTDNTITMIGRKKDMIIRKGYNLYPGIFESTISKIQGIQECAIVGTYNNTIEDERVVLFIVRETGSTISKSDIEDKLRNGRYSIDTQALPDEIVFIGELPRSGRSKKVDKTYLRKRITNIL